MAEVLLKAEKRTDLKRSASKQMRKAGFIPGVFYGAGEKSVAIRSNELALKPIVFSSESQIVNLELEGESKPYSCILKDVQFDPVSGKMVHFDLLCLKEGEKINIEVSIILKGSAIGVREGGLVQHSLYKVEVLCLPQNIPPHIDIDITNLAIGDSVKISDIKIEGVEFLNDQNASIVSVVPPTVEAVEPTVEATTEAPAEPEVISKGKKEEEEKK